MKNAPVVIFAYNRKEHLRRTIESLINNSRAKETDLIIYGDGPRDLEDEKPVHEVRELIDSISGFKKITRFFCDQNIGLAQSIVTGMGYILSRFEKAIIVEDDLIVSPFYLQFMNEALEKYKDDERVGSICAYFYPIKGKLPETFFLREADCWGWATWRRSWKLFNPDGSALLSAIEREGKQDDFDVRGSYPYTQMLRDQITGKNNSWAIRWQASLFLADKLTLYPGRSLVQNIGFDGSGEHCGTTSDFGVKLSNRPVVIADIPVECDRRVEKILAGYFKTISRPRSGIGQKIREWIFRRGS